MVRIIVVPRQQPRVQEPDLILNERNSNYKMPYKDPEKHRECIRRWRENEDNRKNVRMKKWLGRGVVGDLQAIYDRWEQATNCEACGVSFEGIKKCLDHEHTSGEVRFILCNGCNLGDNYLRRKKKIELD